MKRFFAIVLCLTLGIGSLACSAMDGREYIYYTTFEYFNTDLSVRVFADKNKDGKRLKSLFEGEMAELANTTEALVSVAKEGGDIYRYNNAEVGERIRIDPLTAEIINSALEVYRLTNGGYNPAVAMLVDLWGFSPRFRDNEYAGPTMPYDRNIVEGEYSELPSREYVEAFKSLTDLSGFEVEESEGGYYITKTCPSVTVNGKVYTQALDLGGIAKGYVADGCGEILAQNGFKYGVVTLGSSSLSLKSFFDTDVMKSGKWRVSVASPSDRASIFSFRASDCGISTSGTYENCYYIDGKEYGHIIDAASGYPTDNGIKSVTVKGSSAMTGDAITTALCVMGLQAALDFASEHRAEYDIIILVSEGDSFIAYTNLSAGDFDYDGARITEVIAV